MTDKVMPISTAPKDGSKVLVVDHATIACAKWAGDMWAYAVPNDLLCEIDFEPTGWVKDARDFL